MYIRRRGKKWQVVVRLKGHDPISATFENKRAAEEWGKAQEGDILSGRRGKYPAKTLDQAMTRYETDVSAHKRGGATEVLRFEAMRKHFPELAAKVLHQITADDLSRWRDARLKKVTKGTVQRDINTFRNLWTVAAREWGWCGESPWKGMRMPGDNPARRTTWKWQQIRVMLRRLGYRTGVPPAMPKEQVAYMFLLGFQTCMRQSEIHGLTTSSVDLGRRVITLEVHKTLEKAGVREVPIPRRAMKTLRLLAEHATKGHLFTAKLRSVDALFRKYREQVGIDGLTFHDSRATGATLLSRRVDPLTLARLLGHLNLKELMQTYYRESAEQIAARL
jgi:integrase